jgi:hypothetical protein
MKVCPSGGAEGRCSQGLRLVWRSRLPRLYVFIIVAGCLWGLRLVPRSRFPRLFISHSSWVFRNLKGYPVTPCKVLPSALSLQVSSFKFLRCLSSVWGCGMLTYLRACTLRVIKPIHPCSVADLGYSNPCSSTLNYLLPFHCRPSKSILHVWPSLKPQPVYMPICCMIQTSVARPFSSGSSWQWR